MSIRKWWGAVALEVGEQKRWSIGPLRLRVANLETEWRIRTRSGLDPHEDTVSLAETEDVGVAVVEDEETRRYTRSGHDERVELHPRLADRPIVSHPVEPFFVLPGDETRLYVSTPIWVEIRIDEQRPLLELPIMRPSDTWIGATTGDGEAGYASRTYCRTRLDDVPVRPHRSITIVKVKNRATQALRLDRIAVAVPHLSLFASDDDRLWTESITLTREGDDEPVSVEIADHPPREAGKGSLLAGPRTPIAGNRFLSAFDVLF